MINPQILKIVRKIKKARMKLDVLDLTKVKKVTTKSFYAELETMVELIFERPTRKKKAMENGLTFDVILPGSVSHTMYIEVFFDTAGSIVGIALDPGNSIHDKFSDMLFKSKIRRDVEICST